MINVKRSGCEKTFNYYRESPANVGRVARNTLDPQHSRVNCNDIRISDIRKNSHDSGNEF